MNRNIWLFLGFALVLTGVQPAIAQAPAGPPSAARIGAVPDAAQLAPRREGDDMVMGLANAPITIIEYASLTCPHCANFHTATLPQLKTQYIDRGLAKLIYRDFPLDRMALSASMLARCAGPDRYFAFLDVLFRQQQTWTRGNDANEVLGNLKRLARLGGMSDASSESCLGDKATERAVLEQSLKGEREFKVSSTPTIIINGRKYAGDMSFEEIDKTLKPLVGG